MRDEAEGFRPADPQLPGSGAVHNPDHLGGEVKIMRKKRGIKAFMKYWFGKDVEACWPDPKLDDKKVK